MTGSDLAGAFRPAADWELRRFLLDAAAKCMPVEILGRGTKSLVGRPMPGTVPVTTASMTNVTLYEPTELVMGARAGTTVASIEQDLAARGQMLAFEPIDLGPVVGGAAKVGTIGAVFATNLSGSRRVMAGAARDHLLGINAVTGAGDIIKSGGRVMKNVTGVDIARGLTGSWGTLAVMTDVTFKVLPAPETTATLVLSGLPDEIAIEALCLGLGSPFEVTGAVHLQEGLTRRLWHAGMRTVGGAITALRIENFEAFVRYRSAKLIELLKHFGAIQVFDRESSLAFWDELRQLSVLQSSTAPLWRISTTPKLGPKVVAAIGRYMNVEAFYDWSGGLIWLEVPKSSDGGATDIRRVMAIYGGHATLIRADAAVRSAVEVFQPVAPGIERITAKLKATFDPHGILNPGRMYAKL